MRGKTIRLRRFLLPLCAWDYAAEPEAFRQWLEHAGQAGQRFINPPELMAWNMEKTYLCDLAARGAQVIPSVFVPPQKTELADILNQQGWTEAVIKPAFGQSGKGVVKVCADALDVDMADYPQGMIVQPYIREIETAGETSLVFFNGAFSHAMRRQPPQGEWRANSAYGVSVFGIEPPEFAISAAQDVLAALPQMPVYARVMVHWSVTPSCSMSWNSSSQPCICTPAKAQRNALPECWRSCLGNIHQPDFINIINKPQAV